MRKLIECQIMLDGTELDIERIMNELTEISKYEEVVAFTLTEK